jgi:DNA-binding HxlR family transcriptional regulator
MSSNAGGADMQYGQFCPVAKATEILGEKWTLLIIRELLMGGRRFNELQRGLGSISPALLTARLKSLADHGLVVRRKIPGKRGHEYFPASSCNELLPILRSLGDWGMRWAKDNLIDEDYDVELLMLYLERSIAKEKLPGAETTLRFEFTDLSKQRIWWVVVHNDNIDICVKDPGRDVDVYFTATLRTMTDVWLGHRSYKKAIEEGDLFMVGPASLTRTVHLWLRCTEFSA